MHKHSHILNERVLKMCTGDAIYYADIVETLKNNKL